MAGRQQGPPGAVLQRSDPCWLLTFTSYVLDYNTLFYKEEIIDGT